MEQFVKKQDGDCDIEFEEEDRKHVPPTSRGKFLKDVTNKHKKQQKPSQKTKNNIDSQQNMQDLSVIQKSLKFISECRNEKTQRKILYFNGNKIEGVWKDNKLHGYTKIQYQSGELFRGNYENGAKVSGTIKFRDGSQYNGNFSQNLFHGWGSLTDPSGRIITCKWEYGRPQKKVKIQYPSGDIYYGEIKRLQKHGKGYIFFKNGNKYIGEFQFGKITGEGCFYQNDIKIAQGIWKNGVLETQKQTQKSTNSTKRSISTSKSKSKVSFAQPIQSGSDFKLPFTPPKQFTNTNFVF